MLKIVLPRRHAHEKTCQYGLANVHRVELPPQDWIQKPRADRHPHSRLEGAYDLFRRGRIARAYSTNQSFKIGFHKSESSPHYQLGPHYSTGPPRRRNRQAPRGFRRKRTGGAAWGSVVGRPALGVRTHRRPGRVSEPEGVLSQPYLVSAVRAYAVLCLRRIWLRRATSQDPRELAHVVNEVAS